MKHQFVGLRGQLEPIYANVDEIVSSGVEKIVFWRYNFGVLTGRILTIIFINGMEYRINLDDDIGAERLHEILKNDSVQLWEKWRDGDEVGNIADDFRLWDMSFAGIEGSHGHIYVRVGKIVHCILERQFMIAYDHKYLLGNMLVIVILYDKLEYKMKVELEGSAGDLFNILKRSSISTTDKWVQK